jgi:hypothetical protein
MNIKYLEGKKTFKVHGSKIRPINSPKDADNFFSLDVW